VTRHLSAAKVTLVKDDATLSFDIAQLPFKTRALVVASAIGVLLGAQYLIDHEPTLPQSCVPVEIAGVTVVNRRWSHERYFNVASVTTPPRTYQVAVDDTFPESYVGPGALWTETGKWTGWEHRHLTGRCIDPPGQ